MSYNLSVKFSSKFQIIVLLCFTRINLIFLNLSIHSFRKIYLFLGVADNFGRLRSLFAQVWSSFAVIRGLNWLIKKLLVLLGIRTEDEFKVNSTFFL